MEYVQDNSPLQTSVLREFIAITIESVMLIMIVTLMVL